MALDLEEQEQLDELKAWWKRYGNMLANAILGIVLIYVAWQGWTYYQGKQAEEASNIYETLTKVDAKNVKEIRTLSAKLMEGYARTPYAGRAAVIAAQANHLANDTKSAKAQYEWAMAKAKEDAVKIIAGLQLANVLLEEKNYEAALKTLDTGVEGFDGLKADLKGDIYAAQGKVKEAKQAYEAALKSFDAEDTYRQLTQQKLEALGA